jgi:hypothetical protein
MNFESLFQNLVGILKCTFKQSCRESNSKQLLFWGQDLKMPFFRSNLNLGAVWVKFDLKKRKEKLVFALLGRALLSAQLPKLAQLACACARGVVPTMPGRARRVAAMRRRARHAASPTRLHPAWSALLSIALIQPPYLSLSFSLAQH